MRAYREFCQPWLAAQRDAIGSRLYIGVDQKSTRIYPFSKCDYSRNSKGRQGVRDGVLYSLPLLNMVASFSSQL